MTAAFRDILMFQPLLGLGFAFREECQIKLIGQLAQSGQTAFMFNFRLDIRVIGIDRQLMSFTLQQSSRIFQARTAAGVH